jgi:type IV pilus assembly protein PilM
VKILSLLDYLNLNNSRILGLDIGTSSVKGVQLGKSNGKYFLKSCAHVPFRSNSTDEGEIISAIQECVGVCAPVSPYAVCAINGPNITVRGFQFDGIAKNTIGCAVLQEAKQVSPLEMEQSIIDYQITRQSHNRHVKAGILVASATELVFKKNCYAKKAGLQNVLMDVNSIAMLNCFNAFVQQRHGETFALLDIGKSYTNLVIISDTSQPFVRSINSAGKKIMSDISRGTEESEESIEDILNKKTEAKSEIEFCICLERAIKRLTDQIERTFSYYKSHQRECNISKIYICGGFALGQYVEQMLKTQLSEPVEIWNPLKAIDIQQNTDETNRCIEKGSAMAVAIGLAMRTI